MTNSTACALSNAQNWSKSGARSKELPPKKPDQAELHEASQTGFLLNRTPWMKATCPVGDAELETRCSLASAQSEVLNGSVTLTPP